MPKETAKLNAIKSLRVPNIEHRLEDDVPSLGILQSRVGEHATIPADMLDATTFKIFKPILRATRNI